MRKYYIIFLFTGILLACENKVLAPDLETPYESSDSIETATYEEGINWWNNLANSSPLVSITEFGQSDAGRPLHLIKIENDASQKDIWNNDKDKLVLLVNNGIHPGEADGIDASMLYARDLLKQERNEIDLKNVIVLIIPFYNVGGSLNRNCCSRANQNGPPSYGFRGNARNLDLNRDFIKCDSRNARSFSQIIQKWNPDVYVETHVSNGADYQYTMTYLISHPEKMMPSLKEFCTSDLEPFIMESMREKNDECIPYVNVWKNTPDSGYSAFYDQPRYSTGYLNLYNTIGLLTETHMLKPFKDRVMSTHRFLHSITEFSVENKKEIKKLRKKAMKEVLESDSLVIDWMVDYSKFDMLNFKGYKAYYEESEVTGADQLYYDSSSPWEKQIKYYRYMTPGKSIKIPEYYVVPVSWEKVVDLLRANGVEMSLVATDSAMHVEEYKLVNFETSPRPYEGHYFHEHTEVEASDKVALIRKNEYYLISTNQKARRFLIEVLEPEAPDSYFNWNFFDEILQQKEWFSAYVFDREAEELLNDPVVKSKFDSIKESDPELEANPGRQLYEIYKLSDRYERDRHMVYPVFRIN